jgi:hypothetical protein
LRATFERDCWQLDTSGPDLVHAPAAGSFHIAMTQVPLPNIMTIAVRTLNFSSTNRQCVFKKLSASCKKRQSWKLQPAKLHIPLAFVPHFT